MITVILDQYYFPGTLSDCEMGVQVELTLQMTVVVVASVDCTARKKMDMYKTPHPPHMMYVRLGLVRRINLTRVHVRHCYRVVHGP